MSAEEHQELSDLYRAIYLARQAPNSEKTAFAEDIGDVACSRFCELQAICLNAHREHAKGIEKIESAKEARSVKRRRLLLDDAEQQLKRAKGLVDACITHQADLQRKWR